MIQRRNMIVCLSLLVIFACASIADAGLLCGRGPKCGRKCRTTMWCVAMCRTTDNGFCRGEGPTPQDAINDAYAHCTKPIKMCSVSCTKYRRGLFGRCRIEVCEVPVCECGAPGVAEKMVAGRVMAVCPTASGWCYGYGATCELAKANARANCTKPITGPCACPNTVKRKHPCH